MHDEMSMTRPWYYMGAGEHTEYIFQEDRRYDTQNMRLMSLYANARYMVRDGQQFDGINDMTMTLQKTRRASQNSS